MLGIVLLALASAFIGLVYAGSPERLASGVEVAGVDVGGLTPSAARALLERRAARLKYVPVTFFSGRHRWHVTPARLAVRVDWAAAVAAAQHRGDGFGPVRGLRRLKLRLFGGQVAPPVEAWETGLRYELSLFARSIDRPHRDAAHRLRGLTVHAVPGRDGRLLDRQEAASVVVRALASLSRGRPVELPVRIDAQRVRAADLRDAAEQARTALSAPVRL